MISFSWLAVRMGIAIRPPDLDWRLLADFYLLAGTGFTMPLFIASLVFNPELINAAKMGILSASVFSAIAGVALLYLLARLFNAKKNGPAITRQPGS